MGNGAESEKGKRVKHQPTLRLTVYDGPARVGGLWKPEARRGDVSGLVVWSIPSLAGGRSLDASFWADVHVISLVVNYGVPTRSA